MERPKGLLLGAEISRDLRQLEPNELIDRWLRVNELSILFGMDGVGKTRLMMSLACFGALENVHFEGLNKKKAFGSLFILPEGADSAMMAREACIRFHGADCADQIINRVHFVNLLEGDHFALHTEEGFEFIAKTIRYLRAENYQIDALFVDSISMTTNGEQVDAVIVNAALKNLKRIAKQFSLAVLAAGHMNRARKYEGSAMWRRHPVIIREITGDAESKEFRIKETKQRDRGKLETQTYTIENVLIDGLEVDGFATITALKAPTMQQKTKVQLRAKKSSAPLENSRSQIMLDCEAVKLRLAKSGELTRADIHNELGGGSADPARKRGINRALIRLQKQSVIVQTGDLITLRQ